MYKDDYKLLEKFKKTRNLQHITAKGYKTTITQYTRFHKKSFTSLIREAEREEQKKIPWKQRKIRQRLISYREYLIEQDYSLKTIQHYLQRIKTLYNTYEIELRPLPYMSKKNMKQFPPITYKDIPSRKILRQIVLMSKPVFSALILFMTSTGCARKETLSLTINDFVEATRNYHNGGSIKEILRDLMGREDVVGEWNVYRFKTAKYYTTFSSPECMVYLVAYLLSRSDDLSLDSPLFKVNEHYVSDFFSEMNSRLGLGKAGAYNRFRSHSLRKYHASNLYNDGMSLDFVNELQGKAKNKTDSSYFMINPMILRNEYIKHLGSIVIMSDGVDVGVWGKLDLSDLEDFSMFYSSK